MGKRTLYSLESDIRRILEGNDFISTNDESGKQWYMNLVTDLAIFVQQELEKAREEGRREYIKTKRRLLKIEKEEIERTLKDTNQVYPEDILSMERDLLHISQEIKMFERDLVELSKLKEK